MSIELGREINGRYQIEHPLGEGSFGHVYLAQDKMLGESVALKVAREKKPLYVPMWREAAMLRRLNLPGVARLLDEGRTREGFFYFVMELVPGEAMATSTHAWDDVREMIHSALWVLSRIHAHGFVHGDIKPSNVFWHEGQCTILDFGLARGESFDADDPTEMLMGTLAYASPEQLRGESLTPASDVYGLGVMCYELLTGQLPHPSSSFAALARARLMSPAPSLDGVVSDDVPDEIRRVVERMMAREVDDRFASASEVLRALDHQYSASLISGDERIEAWCAGASLELEEIQRWFLGPDTIHHLAEDAAQELWRRTQGDPSQIKQELRAWVAADLVHWQDAHLVITRSVLRRLATGVRLRLASHDNTVPTNLTETAHDVLAWVDMLWPTAEISMVREAAELSEAQWSSVIHVLSDQGHVTQWGELLFTPFVHVAQGHWSDQRRQQAHSRVALLLEQGAPSRSFHVLMGSVSEEGVRALCQEAVALDELGHGADAQPILDEGLRLVRAQRLGAHLESLVLETWGKIVLSAATPQTLERVLFEVENSTCRQHLARLESLLGAARLACLSQGSMALEQLNAIEPLDDIALELRRHQYRVQASWSNPLDVVEPLVDEIVAWAKTTGAEEVVATARGWQAMVAYRQLRFEDAAQFHARAAQDKRRKTGQLSSLLNSANALVDGFEFERALTMARRGRTLAASIRHAHYEGRALFLERACLYRLGRQTEVRLDFVEAVERLGVAEFEGLVCLYEAAIAWRLGERVLADQLASQANRGWSKSGNRWGAELVRALQLVINDETLDTEPQLYWETISSCPMPRVACQIAGLAAASLRGVVELAQFEALVDRLPEGEPQDMRLEVLSIQEARLAFEHPDYLQRVRLALG